MCVRYVYIHIGHATCPSRGPRPLVRQTRNILSVLLVANQLSACIVSGLSEALSDRQVGLKFQLFTYCKPG